MATATLSYEQDAQHQHIEPEADIDTDSALGEEDYLSSTHSLESSTQAWHYENGRRYHGFRSGSECRTIIYRVQGQLTVSEYAFPNDEEEAEREDMKHNVTRWILNDRLHSTFFVESPRRVLDIGTGTGIWAMDFADENPSSFVIAVDLSPIQPQLVPPNLEFQIDDIEDAWTWREGTFDFVHCRYMSSAIKDWPTLIQQSKNALIPGGRIELADFDIEYTSDDATVREDNHLARFCSDLRKAGPRLGINLSACKDYEDMLKSAGFINIQSEIYKLPFGSWPRDRRLKEIGYLHREQFALGMQGIAYGMYGRGMKWSTEAIEALLTGVRNDMMNRRFHGYWLVYFTTAELPTDPNLIHEDEPSTYQEPSSPSHPEQSFTLDNL